MQEDRSKMSSTTASPYYETVADTNHFTETITGERKVTGTWFIQDILTYTTYTLYGFIHITYIKHVL
jgi:hypothetical protein